MNLSRIFIGIGIILAGITAMMSAFLDRTGVTDWVQRLDSPETYTVMATSTSPMATIPAPTFPPAMPTSTTQGAPVVIAKVNIAPQSPPVVKVSPPPTVTQATPSVIGKVNAKEIMDLTNAERVRDGQGILTWNEKLAQMAYQKAKDMLDRQYFAHESPDGKNVAGLAKDVGYLYRLVGENLAVGNFNTNEELIAGWMGSPGHRENMLKGEYTEMGAAAIEGTFEGSPVWMAVQEFGTPFPLCDKPDPKIKEEIDAANVTLASLDESIRIARNAIETATDRDTQTQKISDYNTLVELYNGLVTKTKELVNTYNQSVRTYNACLEA